MHHSHHFGRGLFVYLLAEGTCLHVAVGLNNVHRAIAVKKIGNVLLAVMCCPRRCCCHSLGMIIVDSIPHKCMPVSRTLEPGGKIAALRRRRFSQRHYSRANLAGRVKRRIWMLTLWMGFDSLTSALSKPLQVASPDCASLYSASFELSMLGPPARVIKQKGCSRTIFQLFVWRFSYPSARRFSRKQSNDNAPHSKWHDDVRQDPPDTVSSRPSMWPDTLVPQLQRVCNLSFLKQWRYFNFVQIWWSISNLELL